MAVAAIPPPLETAVGDPAGREAIDALQSRLLELRDLLSPAAAETLGLPIFNGLDGD